MNAITPIILCGGIGSRLWPLSRKSLPKQFAQLVGEQSLFESAVMRVDGDAFADPIVVTSNDNKFLVEKQLRDCGCSGTILLEPERKNTAPAVFAAAHQVMKGIGDMLLLVMPSDHHIPDQNRFVEMILAGRAAAEAGSIVTFGVAPDWPETGYGYIELGDQVMGAASVVKKFHEKPNLQVAQEMVDAGNFVWNAGIFLFRASVMLAHAKQLEPRMLTSVREAVDMAQHDNNFVCIDNSAWEKIQGQSIDYAIMEKTDQIACVKFSGSWSDLGNWYTLAHQLTKDTRGNVISGSAYEFDCQNSILWSATDNITLVGLGLKDVVTVASDDAMLVADVSRVNDINDVVEYFEKNGIRQASEHLKDYRPWGWFESLTKMPGYQVKRLYVYPGAALSLQSHVHRSEHWVVVAGTATVVCDTEVSTLNSNEGIYISAGTIHRLSNDTEDPLVVIEVQTGAYLDEDDIVRYEDIYSRS